MSLCQTQISAAQHRCRQHRSHGRGQWWDFLSALFPRPIKAEGRGDGHPAQGPVDGRDMDRFRPQVSSMTRSAGKCFRISDVCKNFRSKHNRREASGRQHITAESIPSKIGGDRTLTAVLGSGLFVEWPAVLDTAAEESLHFGDSA